MATVKTFLRLVSLGIKSDGSGFGTGAYGNTPFGH